VVGADRAVCALGGNPIWGLCCVEGLVALFLPVAQKQQRTFWFVPSRGGRLPVVRLNPPWCLTVSLMMIFIGTLFCNLLEDAMRLHPQPITCPPPCIVTLLPRGSSMVRMHRPGLSRSSPEGAVIPRRWCLRSLRFWWGGTVKSKMRSITSITSITLVRQPRRRRGGVGALCQRRGAGGGGR